MLFLTIYHVLHVKPMQMLTLLAQRCSVRHCNSKCYVHFISFFTLVFRVQLCSAYILAFITLRLGERAPIYFSKSVIYPHWRSPRSVL